MADEAPEEEKKESSMMRALKRVLGKIVGPSADMKPKIMSELDKEIIKTDRAGNPIN